MKRNLFFRELQVCHCVVGGFPMTFVASAGQLVAVHAGCLPCAVLQQAAARQIPVVKFSREAVFGGCEAPRLSPLCAAIMQIEEYFSGRRHCFHLPIAPAGTDFQLRVWEALRAVPYGETRSYGQIAAAVGSPRGARAVGMACHANPLLIVTPCHRIVGSNGTLTGFAGGLEMKKKLLELECPGLLL